MQALKIFTIVTIAGLLFSCHPARQQQCRPQTVRLCQCESGEEGQSICDANFAWGKCECGPSLPSKRQSYCGTKGQSCGNTGDCCQPFSCLSSTKTCGACIPCKQPCQVSGDCCSDMLCLEGVCKRRGKLRCGDDKIKPRKDFKHPKSDSDAGSSDRDEKCSGCSGSGDYTRDPVLGPFVDPFGR